MGKLSGKPMSPLNLKRGCLERQSFKFDLINNLAYCRMGKSSGKPVSPLYIKSSMV